LLALTFDDGPDPRGTPAVLDALAASNTKATFFVLGERVEQKPALLARILDEGHDVQVHGYEHLRHPESTRDEVEADLNRALKALRAAGVKPTQWRIPWGHLAEFTPALASAHGLSIVGWTSDTHDWRGDSAEAMLEALPLKRGGIVLAHDGIGAGALRMTAKRTAELVGPLVRRAKRLGLEPGPLVPGWPVPIPVGNPAFHPGVVQAA
jgi:peptidoglycan/xylan/chitin deacetylase (PgdA/CDA1 family)